MRKLLWTATLGLLLVAPAALVQDQDRHPNRDRRDRIEDRRDRREDVRDRREDVRDRLARIIRRRPITVEKQTPGRVVQRLRTLKLGQLAKVESRPRKRSLECHGRDGVIPLS